MWERISEKRNDVTRDNAEYAVHMPSAKGVKTPRKRENLTLIPFHGPARSMRKEKLKAFTDGSGQRVSV